MTLPVFYGVASIVAVVGACGVVLWAERRIAAGEDEVLVDGLACAGLVLIAVALWWVAGHPGV